MAKNLKLNIKNAQLAEALKLNQLKKPAAKKTKKAAEEDVVEKPALAKEAESKTIQEVAAPAPAAPKEPEVAAPAAPVQKPEEEKPIESLKAEPIKPKHAPAEQLGPVRRETPPHERLGPVRRETPPHERLGPVRRETPPHERLGPVRRETPSHERLGPVRREGHSSEQFGPVRREGGAPFVRRPGGPHYGSAERPSRPGYEGRPPHARPPMHGGPGGTRPPFRREGAPDFRRSMPPIEPLKESSREAPPVKKTQAESDEEKLRKASPSKDVRDIKAQKKPEAYRSFDSRDRQGLRNDEDQMWRKRRAHKMPKQQIQEEIIRPKSLKVRLPISVKDLAAEMKLKASQLIAKMFLQGVVITLNDYLDDETTVQLLGHEFECEITIDTAEEKRLQVTDKTIKDEIKECPADVVKLRPPVITFMGHVDHGKTSLIDAIRKSNRVAGEAGAITQHIGAFKCHTAVGDITVLDTPGHEAFSAMRERGADVTDIVVLVVAGDEGMRAQTIEAMNQAKEANVPIVVAINKSDKPNFNPEVVYRQLADHSLLPETWGGTTITVNCSAVTGQGIKELLEMLALQAEILELKANPSMRARGTVIESEMHKGLGAVASVLVQNGTLRLGDSIVFGQHYARIKTMHDEYGKELTAAPPSTPVKITGLSGLAEAGSEFVAVKDEKEARDISQKRSEGLKSTQLQQSKRGSLESFLQQKAELKEKKILNLIVKADVQGSLEALKNSLLKIPSKKVEINFISEGVGEVSESDIQFAATSKATILGFHTKVESHAESLIKQLKVNVRLHDVIYHAVDDIKEIMLGLLDKIPQENNTGTAIVKAVFRSSQLGNIAGCQVADGIIKRNCHIRVIRNKEQIWKGQIASLKRVKEDVREVSKGYECGILLQGFNDYKEGDELEAFEITYLTQELT